MRKFPFLIILAACSGALAIVACSSDDTEESTPGGSTAGAGGSSAGSGGSSAGSGGSKAGSGGSAAGAGGSSAGSGGSSAGSGGSSAGSGGSSAGSGGATAGSGGASGAGGGAAGTGGAGGEGGGAAGGAGEGGSSAGGAAGSAGAGGANQTLSGSVSVMSYLAAPGYYVNSASAGFSKVVGSPGGGGTCTVETIGNCQVSSCDVVMGGQGGAGGSPMLASAGEITINGGTFPVKLLPSASAEYATDPQPLPHDMALFDGSQTLTIAAAGAEVPAFSVDLKTPGLLTISSPVPPAAGSMLDVDTSADLVFQYTGGKAGETLGVIVNEIASAGDHVTSISCELDPASSSDKVPAAALAKLPKAQGSSSNMIVSVSVRDIVTAGDYQVYVSSGMPPVSSGGSPFGVILLNLK